MYGTAFIGVSEIEKRGFMKRFISFVQPFLSYYIVMFIVLLILYYFFNNAFILGLMVGLVGSLINTLIFEYYLNQSIKKTSGAISTGNGWRYFIAILCCVVWLLFKDQLHIIGILIGLLVSYVLIICRPLFKHD